MTPPIDDRQNKETFNTLYPIIEKTSGFVEVAAQATKHTSQAIERLETDCRERQNELFDKVTRTLSTVKECLTANVPADDGHGSTITVPKTLAQILVDSLNKQAKKDQQIIDAISEIKTEVSTQNKWIKIASIISAILAAVITVAGAVFKMFIAVGDKVQ